MVTNTKKRKSTTVVNEPQKKSPKVNKRKVKPTPPDNEETVPSDAAANEANGKLKKKATAKAKKAEASPAKTPAVKPKEKKKDVKASKVKQESAAETDQKLSKSIKSRLLRKRRMNNLKEMAEQGDEETLTKIRGVIKRIEEAGQVSKHSHRKLVQYKKLLALYTKDSKSPRKKTKKTSK